MYRWIAEMLHPQFKVGEHVEFECSRRKPHNQPRWLMNSDTTGNNTWACGRIHEIRPDVIVVEYEIEGFVGKGMAEWPNTTHPDYDSNQWKQDGYLRRVEHDRLNCQCGAEAVYGRTTSHSHWCPRAQT